MKHDEWRKRGMMATAQEAWRIWLSTPEGRAWKNMLDDVATEEGAEVDFYTDRRGAKNFAVPGVREKSMRAAKTCLSDRFDLELGIDSIEKAWKEQRRDGFSAFDTILQGIKNVHGGDALLGEVFRDPLSMRNAFMQGLKNRQWDDTDTLLRDALDRASKEQRRNGAPYAATILLRLRSKKT
jgi:hypothetical protein